MDPVTEILLERSEKFDNLTRMMMVSLVAHAAVVTAITLLPSQWRTPRDNSPVMTISLAGAPGPIQGRNPISGRPIQEAVPDTAKPRNDTTPAPTKPEMVEPIKAAKPLPKVPPKPEPKKEEPLRGRTPTQGAEVKAGAARVDTQGAATTPFGGFATGGGGAGSAYTDFADFCCPEYLARMQTMIYANWQQRQGVDGSNVVKFTIGRDGTISAVEIEQGANDFLNRASQRAIALTQRLPPLPTAFTPSQLTVHLVFQYKR